MARLPIRRGQDVGDLGGQADTLFLALGFDSSDSAFLIGKIELNRNNGDLFWFNFLCRRRLLGINHGPQFFR